MEGAGWKGMRLVMRLVGIWVAYGVWQGQTGEGGVVRAAQRWAECSVPREPSEATPRGKRAGVCVCFFTEPTRLTEKTSQHKERGGARHKTTSISSGAGEGKSQELCLWSTGYR